jgi:membrane protein EpsK
MIEEQSRSEGSLARSRFGLNIVSNLAYLALSTLLMLWYIPFLIDNLGVSGYGLVPLVTAVVGYAAIIADSLSVTVLRFLAIDINKQNWTRANRTFNTALSVLCAFSLAMLPLVAAISWLFPHFFKVVEGSENDSRILFAGAAVALLLVLIGSSFGVSTIILHRFDLRNLVLSLSLLTRVGIAVVAFQLVGPEPWQIGFAFVLSGLVSLFGNWLVWRRLTPQLEIHWLQVDREQLWGMSALGGWIIVVRLGILLFLSTDLLVVNIVFGPEMSGRYGALLLFAELVRQLAQAGSTIISPAIIAHYAREDLEALRSLVARSVKLMTLTAALPVGLICGFAGPLLVTWLGEGFAPFSVLLIAIMAPNVIGSGILPLGYVLVSHNRLQLQGVTTVGLGCLNVVLAVAAARWSGLGPLGVALVTLITFSGSNLLLASYSAKVMGLSWYSFYPMLFNGVVHAALGALAGYCLSELWRPEGWLHLGIEAAMVSLLYAVAVYFIAFNADDRAFALRLVRTTFGR